MNMPVACLAQCARGGLTFDTFVRFPQMMPIKKGTKGAVTIERAMGSPPRFTPACAGSLVAASLRCRGHAPACPRTCSALHSVRFPCILLKKKTPVGAFFLERAMGSPPRFTPACAGSLVAASLRCRGHAPACPRTCSALHSVRFPCILLKKKHLLVFFFLSGRWESNHRYQAKSITWQNHSKTNKDRGAGDFSKEVMEIGFNSFYFVLIHFRVFQINGHQMGTRFFRHFVFNRGIIFKIQIFETGFVNGTGVRVTPVPV
ncbi:MAG: hypothetical protein HQM16_14325 [Deltaproteobacteria bacterium]|nr:hypothetical protein [Deltaproteobacteria bacterium]